MPQTLEVKMGTTPNTKNNNSKNSHNINTNKASTSCVAIKFVVLFGKTSDHMGDVKNAAFQSITLIESMPALSAMLTVRWMDNT